MKPLPPVTGAFPPNVKPARPGVYEVTLPGVARPVWGWFSLWTGSHWCMVRALPASAAAEVCRSWVHGFRWRGLSADPATYAVPDDVDGPPLRPAITLVLNPLTEPVPTFDASLDPILTRRLLPIDFAPVPRSAVLPSGWPVLLGALLCVIAFLVSLL